VLEYAGTFSKGDLTTGFSFFNVTNPTSGTIRVGGFTVGNEIAAGAGGTIVCVDFNVLSCQTTSLVLGNVVDDIANWNPCNGEVACCTDNDGDGYAIEGGDCGLIDCDDADPDVNPGATEITCNGKDDDCNELTLDNPDGDGDGYGVCDDCDDTNPAVNPGATEISCNLIDDDCNPLTLDNPDGDGDSYGICDDCDDANPAVNPGATEVCNGIDDNCNGEVDEGVKLTFYQDADGDNYGNAAASVEACEAPAGYVSDSSDCDDSNADVHPGAPEQCNGIDDDCDGEIDEDVAMLTYYQDADSDGFGNPAVSQEACSQPEGYVPDNTDCNDSNPAVNPGATEVCNEIGRAHV